MLALQPGPASGRRGSNTAISYFAPGQKHPCNKLENPPSTTILVDAAAIHFLGWLANEQSRSRAQIRKPPLGQHWPACLASQPLHLASMPGPTAPPQSPPYRKQCRWKTWLQLSFLLRPAAVSSSRQMMHTWSARTRSSSVASGNRWSMFAATATGEEQVRP